MKNETNPASAQALSLKSLKLRAGLALQIKRQAAGALKEEAQYLATLGEKGIMVGPPQSDVKNTLEVGHEYVVSGFTGQYDFSFASKVLQTYEQPFVYALFDYPATIDARLVRRAMRIKMALPAKLKSSLQVQPLDVTLIDLSHCGAMAHSPKPLGAFGDVVYLLLSIEFEGSMVDLIIPSTICHSNKAANGEGVNIGLSFKTTSHSDKLMLYFLEQSAND